MLFYDKSIRGYTWNKLYRKSFLDKFCLTFLDAHHFVEDYAFNFVALLHTNKVNFINDFVYVYVYHQNSISNKNIATQIDRFIFTFALLKLFCVQKNYNSAVKICFSQKKIFFIYSRLVVI